METEQADSGSKRKLLSRKRHRTWGKEGDSQKYEFLRAKTSCKRRKKETIDACNSIHGGGCADKSPNEMWLPLVNESTPVRLANYVHTSSKMMKKVVTKVCKMPIKDFVNSFKVLYGKGLLSKEQSKAIRLNLTMTPCFTFIFFSWRNSLLTLQIQAQAHARKILALEIIIGKLKFYTKHKFQGYAEKQLKYFLWFSFVSEFTY